jgi:hypothetical protein
MNDFGAIVAAASTSARYGESSLLDILVRKQLYIFLLQGKQYKDQLSKERMAFD